LGVDSGSRLTTLTIDFHEFIGQVTKENQAVLQYGPFFQWSEKVRKDNPVPSGPLNPQALNRYSYCLNNPLRYIDPTGHDSLIFQITFKNDKAWDFFVSKVQGSITLLEFEGAVGAFAAGVGGVGIGLLSQQWGAMSAMVPAGAMLGGYDALMLRSALNEMEPYAAMAFNPDNTNGSHEFVITVEITRDPELGGKTDVYISIPGREKQLWVPCSTRKCAGAYFADALDNTLVAGYNDHSMWAVPLPLQYTPDK
jgi:hypothetical protein